jgi:hypothetical protein
VNQDVLATVQQNLRGTDSNSLLRLYDQTREIFLQSKSQQERTRAEKALQRITRELNKREVPISADAPEPPSVDGSKALLNL